MKHKAIVCTGGGTGGHVFPALAVLERFQEQWRDSNIRWNIAWIGSLYGIERRIIREESRKQADAPSPKISKTPLQDSVTLKYWGIPSGKLRRYFSWRNVFDIFGVIGGICCAVWLLLRLRPLLVFSKGGYVSVPVVCAARILGISVISHESDYSPGLATRINTYSSRYTILPYQESKKFFPETVRRRLLVYGNPVRRAMLDGDAQKGYAALRLNKKYPILLFLGGSKGSQEINQLIESIVAVLTNRFHVIHQTGHILKSWRSQGDEWEAQNIGPGKYIRRPFFEDDLPHLLAAAKMVVCRAGAGTLWELAAHTKPSILIPLRGEGTRGDQIQNANFFRRLGAAVVLEPYNGQELFMVLDSYINSPARLSAMRKAMAALPSKDAASRIAALLVELIQKKRGVL